jgi:hypothetical protein
MDKFPYSSAPLRRVKAVQFGIIDPDFLVRWCLACSDWVPRCTHFLTLQRIGRMLITRMS